MMHGYAWGMGMGWMGLIGLLTDRGPREVPRDGVEELTA
jgi:hypothetical protein